MDTTELFREAIEVAKAVREAAVINAKDALEEKITPHIKELLAEKLEKMNEEDVDEASDVAYKQKVSESEVEESVEEEANEASDVAYKNAVSESEEEEEGEAEVDTDVDADDSEESEEEGEAEEDMSIEDMTVADFKELIRDIIAQELGGSEEGGEEFSDDMADVSAGDDMDSGEEEIDLDELLAELEAELEETNHAAKDAREYKAMGQEAAVPAKPGTSVQESEDANEEVEEGFDTADAAARGFDNIKKGVKKTFDKHRGTGKKVSDKMKQLGKAAASAIHREEVEESNDSVAELKSQLQEALDTIKKLNESNKETNLLNAKLMYLNKVFKAHNLTESQKADVITSFDKAETVKEAKLVYETITSSITNKKETVKESVVKVGRASKAAGVFNKPKGILTEADEQVKRFQKLAGIIK